VTGKTTYDIAGKRVRDILKNCGFEPNIAFCSKADLETVEKVKQQAEAFNADSVVGVGGGRTIDVAKLSADRSRSFFISVPTTAAHDGIASSLASVKGLGRPYSLKAVSPIAVLADSKIVSESPYKFTASGCGDVISKAVSVRDWRLAHEKNGDYYGEYAGSLALMSSNLIMKNAQLISERTEEGYRTLLEALVSCGVAMSIAGSSRPCSGSEHLFSHTLDMIAPDIALHGEQCGLGSIMMARLHDIDWLALRDSLKVIGVPINAAELGVSSHIIVEALVKAREIRPERYTILTEAKLTHKLAKGLAQDCDVI
jgi:glycerol-1-phosphate dehydrogenase [NAD(P)+]